MHRLPRRSRRSSERCVPWFPNMCRAKSIAMKRRIAAVTTSRADFTALYWPLHDLASHPDVDLKIIALGPHLSPEFGSTVQEIEKDGFHVDARIECLLSSDTDVGMAKTIGLATLSLADCLGEMRPDLLLVTADRYEMLAPASVALALRIPVAHIEGGEISEGAIDDAVRNALTKLSHVHFTSTELARARVIAMGEEEWRVHRTGRAIAGSSAAQSAVEPRTTGAASGHRPRRAYSGSHVPSDDHRSGHYAGGGRSVRGAESDAGAASVLLSKRRCRQPRADRANRIVPARSGVAGYSSTWSRWSIGVCCSMSSSCSEIPAAGSLRRRPSLCPR